MALCQGRSTRKVSGGRYKTARGKKKAEIGREQMHTTMGKEVKREIRTCGGSQKFRLLQANKVNLFDPKQKKTSKAEIKTVMENPANPNYVRRNIITKGAIIDTTKGKARVTSRPGQHGTINAILIS
jgi:small subunit ribosomal protein S8e